MGGDVRASLARRVVAQPVRDRVDPAERALGAADVAERRGVGREQLEDRDRVGAGPFAQRPRLVPADRARGGEANERHPAVQRNHRGRSVTAETEVALSAVGQCEPDSSRRELVVDLVEQPADGRGGEAGERPAAGREAPVRAHQMLAARAHAGQL